jgi:group I intron endonuclease
VSERSLSFIVYKAVNQKNGKTYIGITQRSLRRRIRDHWTRRGKYPFSAALRKYGIEAFVISIVERVPSEQLAVQRERFWIETLDCKAPRGYNLTDGGEGVLGLAEESRKRIGDARRGKPLSEAHRQAVSTTLMGNIPWNKGKRLSTEHCKNLSDAHMGHVQSEETKRKRSESIKAAHARLGMNWNNQRMETNAKGQWVRALPDE